MDESILNSIKDFLGINPEDTGFDQEIIMHVNSSMSTLYQIGIDFGDTKRIVDSDTVWSDLFSDYDNSIDLIKLYVSTKVKVSFDPPSSSFIAFSTNELDGGSKETLTLVETYNLIKSIELYVSTKVKVSFDPPSSSFVLNAMNEQIQELEWRIFIEAGGDFDAIR